MSSQNSPLCTSEPSSNTQFELEQQMLEWKEKQEIAQAQEEQIIEDDLKYREYAEQQNDKYTKHNDDMTTFTIADTPKVQIYKNYVLYDRFMPYNRFRPSIKYNENPYDNSEEAEKQYYYNNYHNFLVVKFSRTTKDVILFDSTYYYLYIACNPLSNQSVQRVETGDYPYLEITSTVKDVCCLNIIDDMGCTNIHNNGNGYCNDCQYNSQELKKLNCDNFLTYSEFICLPEFKDFYDLEFQYDERYCDSDSDYDDRKHGPEYTVEDDSDDEDYTIEEKEEIWMEGEDECKRKTIKGIHSFSEYTTKNGRFHSFNDQPAIVDEKDNFNKTSYVWYKDGIKHRLTGVAEQFHCDIKDIASYDWWIEGVRYHTKKEYEEAVKAYKN